MESHASDADCLARSLTEPRAFEALFDRHFAEVHRYLHRRAGRDIADDLAAETFAVAFELGRSRRSPLRWYLNRIALKRAIQMLRNAEHQSSG